MQLLDKFITKDSNNRLYACPVAIIGLTGGIATGKSTVVNYLKQQGLPVICADQLIKDIYQKKESFEFIAANFNECIIENKIDFKSLRKLAFNDIKVRKSLENFLYPQLNSSFFQRYHELDVNNFVIFDVPLLFEHHINRQVDLTICVYSSKEQQLERIIARDNIDHLLAEKIVAQQMDIDSKAKLADFIIDNSKNQNDLLNEISLVTSKIFT